MLIALVFCKNSFEGFYVLDYETLLSYFFTKQLFPAPPVSSVPLPRLASGDAGAGEDRNGGGLEVL